MPVIKGLPGNPSVGIAGKTPLNFVNYGQIAAPAGGATFSAVARRHTILVDPARPDSVTITAPPAPPVRAFARPDGSIGLDLNEVTAADVGGTVTFSYRAVAGTQVRTVDATVAVAEAEKPAGWGPGKHYYPELDAADAVVVEPTLKTRVIHISELNGLTAEAIAAAEPTLSAASQVTAAWLLATPAAGGGGAFYGETPALALTEALGTALYSALEQEANSPWILYERGGTYADTPPMGNRRGYSKLHPMYLGSYGSGPLPVFTNTRLSVPDSFTARYVLQDMHIKGSMTLLTTSHGIADNIRATCENIAVTNPVTIQGISMFSESVGLRRFYSYKALPGYPVDPLVWGRGNSDRFSASYQQATRHLFMEKIWTGMTGWAWGYLASRSTAAGKSPEDRSHDIYQQSTNFDCTVRDVVSLTPAFSTMQNRSGGHVDRVFSAGANAGVAPGNGYGNPVTGELGNWNLLRDWVQTIGGHKDFWAGEVDLQTALTVQAPQVGEVLTGTVNGASGTVYLVQENKVYLGADARGTFKADERITGSLGADVTAKGTNRVGGGYQGVLAGGVAIQAPRTGLRRVVLAHVGAGIPLTGPDDVGPVGNGQGGTEVYSVRSSATGFMELADYKVRSWHPENQPAVNPDTGLEGLDPAALDAATLGAFVDSHFGVTGTAAKRPLEQVMDLIDHTRDMDAPWEVLPALLAWFQDPFGYGRPLRSAARTVAFLPHALGHTDGMRADDRENWDTEDLPGTVAGDSIDLGSYRVRWNLTPRNAIADLVFGAGGMLLMHGGALRPTGAVTTATGGNTIRMDGGAKLAIPGYAGPDRLTLRASEARLENTGSVTGPVDVTVLNRGELLFGLDGASWSVGTGSVTVMGQARAGFDGASGGTAGLTFSSASTLTLKSSAILVIGGLAAATGLDVIDPDASVGHAGGGDVKAKILPDVGTVLTGAASAASGVVTEVLQIDNVTCLVYLDDCTGTFEAGETVSGGANAGGIFPIAPQALGTLDVAPAYHLPQIAEFCSGRFGRVAPDVASAVTLDPGMTLNLDVTGMANGDYDLIVADTLSGTAPAPNVTGGSGTLSIVGGTTLRLTKTA